MFASFKQFDALVQVTVPDGTTPEQVAALYPEAVDIVIAATSHPGVVLADAARFRQAIKAECGRRIMAVASQNAQMNMTAACAAGVMSDADKATYAASLLWVAQMRARCAALIDAADPGYTDDTKWPPCPAPVVALAARF